MEKRNKIYNQKCVNIFQRRYVQRKVAIQNQNRKSEELLYSSSIEKKSNISSLVQKNLSLNLYINNQLIDTSKYANTFSQLDFNVPSVLLDNLSSRGFESMTPIQRLSIPSSLSLIDVVGCAQTGSGKTISYLFPIISLLLSNSDDIYEINKKERKSFPLAVILLPTRELAIQTYEEALKLVYNTNIIVTVVYGGEAYNEQIYNLRQGCDILIGTPGRLLNYIEKDIADLSEVKYLVIDEADDMLDMGFIPDVDRIISEMPETNQRMNMLFSATFPRKIVDQVISVYIKENYAYITPGEGEFTDDNTPNMNIDQRFYYIDSKDIFDKVDALHQLLQIIRGKTIIFVNTKRDVEGLAKVMNEKNYNVGKIHGDMDQEKRREVMAMFSKGEIPLLIATDVASRGLDIPQIDFVINFDMPTNIEDYVHRIGRTGRCGIKGRSLTLLAPYDQGMFYSIRDMLKRSNQKIPDFLS